jgi:hypothetical protein
MKSQTKKTGTALFIMIILLISSCQINQSVKKDLTTGAFSRGDGIGVAGISIEVNGTIDNRNNYVFGENVKVIFNNVSGLKQTEGKTFPELSMYIVKNEKDTVLAEPNLLKSLSNGTDLSPLQLQASFGAGFPNQNNEKYKLFIEITDQKGDGSFNYELPFTIKENNVLDIKSSGIDYSAIYLWNETRREPVLDNNISFEDQYILILNDIEGLELINDKVYPIFSIDITDNDGNKILYNPNLLGSLEQVGVSPEDLKSQVTANISFQKGTISNPCTLTAKFKDKNSLKKVVITSKLSLN